MRPVSNRFFTVSEPIPAEAKLSKPKEEIPTSKQKKLEPNPEENPDILKNINLKSETKPGKNYNLNDRHLCIFTALKIRKIIDSYNKKFYF